MKIIDPGHRYSLDHLDGNLQELLTFVKREGPKYPGNVGSHPGTNTQEVIRALIDRTRYVNCQIPHPANNDVITGLRGALYALEYRAAERHGRPHPEYGEDLESRDTCRCCGHIECSDPEHLSAQPSRPVEAATQSQIILALRKKIHLTEHHNQFFERCEIRWCNPNPPLASGIGLEDLSDPATGQHVGDPFAVAVAIEVEKRMKALAPVEAAGPNDELITAFNNLLRAASRVDEWLAGLYCACPNFGDTIEIAQQVLMRAIEVPTPPISVETTGPTDMQRKIDISNLRFYARLFRQHEWSDTVIHWGVFEQTLNEIATRLEAGFQPPADTGADSKRLSWLESHVEELTRISRTLNDTWNLQYVSDVSGCIAEEETTEGIRVLIDAAMEVQPLADTREPTFTHDGIDITPSSSDTREPTFTHDGIDITPSSSDTREPEQTTAIQTIYSIATRELAEPGIHTGTLSAICTLIESGPWTEGTGKPAEPVRETKS